LGFGRDPPKIASSNPSGMLTSPGVTFFDWQARNAATMSGSNWVPEQRRISAIASETGSAFLYAVVEVIASKVLAIVMMREARGIVFPARREGYPFPSNRSWWCRMAGKRGRLPLEILLAERVLDGDQQDVEVERFRDVFARPYLARVDGGVEFGVGGHDDARGPGRPLSPLAEKRDPVHDGHPDLGEKDVVRAAAREHGQRLGPVGRLLHGVPRDFEAFPDDGTEEFLTIDHEDANL
jgi:hypothetical protein